MPELAAGQEFPKGLYQENKFYMLTPNICMTLNVLFLGNDLASFFGNPSGN